MNCGKIAGPSLRDMRHSLPTFVMMVALLSIVAARSAHAQRASENAVTQADDAFGTTIGSEKIGIYNEDDVRGFSPIQAGNARIEGLYVDKVGD
jgi:iron complex outermembrane receptor protein